MKKLIISVLSCCLICFTVLMPVNAQEKIVITIDPGHGGKDPGASYVHNGKRIYEKNMTLTIALAMRDELNTYDNVKVYMTRTTDKYPSLYDRAKYAKNKNSNLLFSVHIDASGNHKASGARALVSRGKYRPALAKVTKAIGAKALEYITNVSGIVGKGYLLRTLSSSKYPNGYLADYYYIVRQGVYDNIPSMIMEHGYIDNSADYNKMNTTAKLQKLGQADATAVAEYYGLKKKSAVNAEKAQESLLEAETALQDAKDLLSEAQTQYDDAAKSIDDLNDALENAQTQVDETNASIEDIQTQLNDNQEAIDNFNQEDDRTDQTQFDESDLNDDNNPDQNLLTANQQVTLEELLQLKEELEAKLEELKTLLVDYQNALAELQTNYDENIATLKAAFEETKTAVEDAEIALEEAQTEYDTLLAAYNESKSLKEADENFLAKITKRSQTPDVTTKNTNSGVKLSWDQVSEATGYIVKRADSTSGPFTVVKTLTIDKTSWTDKTLTNGQTCVYRVYSVLQDGNRASSKKTVTRLTAPEIKSLKNVKKLSIKLKWSKNSKASGYQVRYVRSGVTQYKTYKGASAVSKTWTCCKKNKTYSISVRAFKTVNNKTSYSPYSPVKTVYIKK